MKKLLSALYSYIVRKRNRKFDSGIGVQKVSVPVISVGNITVGGTGKTPFTIALSNLLKSSGNTIAIVSRGYKRKSKGVKLISNGSNFVNGVQQSGDELQTIARYLPTSIVVAAEQRYAGAQFALLHHTPSVVVIDDGFQHRTFHRDCDIVLIDDNTLAQTHCVPAGLLREPLESLQRSHILIAMNGVDVSRLNKLNSHAVVCSATTEFSHFSSWNWNEPIQPNASQLRCVCATSIANSHRLIDTLQQQGFTVAKHRSFKDHHWFTEQDVQNLLVTMREERCSTLCVTAKDAVKLEEFASVFALAEITVYVVHITTKIHNQELLLATIQKLCNI